MLVASQQKWKRIGALISTVRHAVCNNSTTMIVVPTITAARIIEQHLETLFFEQSMASSDTHPILTIRQDQPNHEFLLDSNFSIGSLVSDWKELGHVPDILSDVASTIKEIWRLLDQLRPYNRSELREANFPELRESFLVRTRVEELLRKVQ